MSHDQQDVQSFADGNLQHKLDLSNSWQTEKCDWSGSEKAIQGYA